MSEPAYDYGTTSEPVGEDKLTRITNLAREMLNAELEVAVAEQNLKDAQAKLRDISQFKLPALMEEVGQTEFKLKDGTKISLKEDVKASIPKASQDAAFKYLEDHGHGALIKREIKVSFGKDEEAWAKKFMADLAKRKKPVKAENKRSVHPQTLQAWLREQLSNGEPVPLETFGAFIYKVAKADLPDGAKPIKAPKGEDSLF